MKTLIIIFAFLTMFIGIPAHASGNFDSTDKTQIICTKIQENMHVPQIMKNSVSTEHVRVVFTIDENGKAQVVEVNTKRPDLKASIISQFESIDFSEVKNSSTEQYSIWLTFKVL